MKTAGKEDKLKEVQRALNQIEAELDKEYLAKVPPFKPTPSTEHPKNGRVAVMELFVDTQIEFPPVPRPPSMRCSRPIRPATWSCSSTMGRKGRPAQQPRRRRTLVIIIAGSSPARLDTVPVAVINGKDPWNTAIGVAVDRPVR